jgi:enoyl-CoA hydratase/carnithine racemase
VAYQNIQLKKEGGLATITLNRPEVLNALSPQLLAELKAALDEVDKDESIIAVVLRGAGRCFSVGLDLKVAGSWLEEGNEKAIKENLILPGLELGETIDNLRQPVIAGVHGFAITGGFFLVYCCDLVVATEDAWLQDTHARWGLVPAWQESQRLLRTVGIHRAKALFLTSDHITAQQAYEMGLVYKVVPEGKLDEGINEIVGKLLQQSPASLAILKAQLSRGMKSDWITATKIDEWTRQRRVIADVMTGDAKPRLKAFREKAAKATD